MIRSYYKNENQDIARLEQQASEEYHILNLKYPYNPVRTITNSETYRKTSTNVIDIMGIRLAGALL